MSNLSVSVEAGNNKPQDVSSRFRMMRGRGVQRCFSEATQLLPLGQATSAWASATNLSVAGFNQVFVDPQGDPSLWQQHLQAGVEFMKACAVPFVVKMPYSALPPVAFHCPGVGALVPEDDATPMMLADWGTAPQRATAIDRYAHLPVERVEDVELLHACRHLLGDVMEEAGWEALQICSPTWNSLFTLRDPSSGLPITMVTATVLGDGVIGISAMQTAPSEQRKGYGASLLSRVMTKYLQEGCTWFILGSTSEGQRLYHSLGFREVEKWGTWSVQKEQDAAV